MGIKPIERELFYVLPEGLKQNEIKGNSPRHKCGHCGNEKCTDLIASFTHTFFDEDSSNAEYTTWDIYFCPVCYKLNIKVTYENTWDRYTDRNGAVDLISVIKVLYPVSSDNTIPKMNKSLPNEMIGDYEEAKNVAGISPRSAAALLRLLLEKLCKKYLLENNKIKGSENLNIMIGILVKEGISDIIQKACDILRITGNETVHAGTIDIRDNPKSVILLFELVNMVADDFYMKYKRIPEMYSTLPADKVKGIENRDSQKYIMGDD